MHYQYFLKPIINDENNRVYRDGWFGCCIWNWTWSFADRRLNLAVEIGERRGILFNKLNLTSSYIILLLELSRKNVSIRPYQSVFHISALLSTLTLRWQKDPDITLRCYLKCSELFLCWEKMCSEKHWSGNSSVFQFRAINMIC